MIREFNYKAPVKYLLAGFLCFLMASIFLYATSNAFKDGQIWFPLFTLMFGSILAHGGYRLLKLYFQNSKHQKVVLGENFIELPGRKVNRKRLNFAEIKEISEFDTYDNVLLLETTHDIYHIEKNWMKQEDFNCVQDTLRAYWSTKKRTNTVLSFLILITRFLNPAFPMSGPIANPSEFDLVTS